MLTTLILMAHLMLVERAQPTPDWQSPDAMAAMNATHQLVMDLIKINLITPNDTPNSPIIHVDYEGEEGYRVIVAITRQLTPDLQQRMPKSIDGFPIRIKVDPPVKIGCPANADCSAKLDPKQAEALQDLYKRMKDLPDYQSVYFDQSTQSFIVLVEEFTPRDMDFPPSINGWPIKIVDSKGEKRDPKSIASGGPFILMR
jgi:hypothetical protein